MLRLYDVQDFQLQCCSSASAKPRTTSDPQRSSIKLESNLEEEEDIIMDQFIIETIALPNSHDDNSLISVEEIFECAFCLRKFKKLKSLESHCAKFHNPDKQKLVAQNVKRQITNRKKSPPKQISVRVLMCDVCNQEFRSKNAMKAHMKTHVESDRTHQCKKCGKMFQSETHLLRHSYFHGGERKFICEICKRAFVGICHLKRHKCHFKQSP